MKRLILAALILGTAAHAWAAPYVILNNGQRYDGVRIRATFDRKVILVNDKQIELTFTADQVKMAVADKPANMDAAVTAFRNKQYDAAITELKKIIQDYRFLSWDREAVRILVAAYIAKGEPAPAVRACEDLFKVYPQDENSGEVLWAYMDAQVALKQFDKVEPRLDKLVKDGSRGDAARALVVRGDIRRNEGKLELAVRNYLRAVWFFGRERQVMPKALLKAGQTLEQLRDPRAKRMYTQLVEEFPESPEAQEAKTKI